MSLFLKTLALSLALAAVTFSQPRTEIPLTVTSLPDADTLYFGSFSGAHVCLTPQDTMNGHAECSLPPPPPSGVFDARFVERRTGLDSCFCTGGSLCDYRPAVSPTQRDTLTLQCQHGSGQSLVLVWRGGLGACFATAELRYFDEDLGQNINIDMLSDTLVIITSTGDPVRVSIFVRGLAAQVPPSTGIAGMYRLGPNFPNPFNPATSIRYTVPPGTHTPISLRVYDVLGREVTTLVDELPQPGDHVVAWKPDALASGVYICRLTTPTAVLTMKMLLLR